jgi:hypothetical protein
MNDVKLTMIVNGYVSPEIGIRQFVTRELDLIDIDQDGDVLNNERKSTYLETEGPEDVVNRIVAEAKRQNRYERHAITNL